MSEKIIKSITDIQKSLFDLKLFLKNYPEATDLKTISRVVAEVLENLADVEKYKFEAISFLGDIIPDGKIGTLEMLPKVKEAETSLRVFASLFKMTSVIADNNNENEERN